MARLPSVSKDVLGQSGQSSGTIGSRLVIVATDMQCSLLEMLANYDIRTGVPENSLCQDNQGLAARKRRKQKFEAQQMLVLLSQLAHNLIQ